MALPIRGEPLIVESWQTPKKMRNTQIILWGVFFDMYTFLVMESAQLQLGPISA